MSKGAVNIEATALFYSRPKPDVVKLMGEMNMRLANVSGAYVSMSPLSTEDWWLLNCDDFHVMITFGKEELPQDTLAEPLRSRATTLTRFDYEQAVGSHQAFARIEVGDGSAPLPPEARDIMTELAEVKRCTPELKMKILHWVSQHITGHEGFLALHFGPSDRLFCPDELEDAAAFDWPEPLLMHTQTSHPERGPNGSEGYRVFLKNPQLLPHTAIELEGVPTAVAYQTVDRLIRTITRAFVYSALPLAHGDTIRPTGSWALYVRHTAPEPTHPNGKIILSFWADRGHLDPAPLDTNISAPDMHRATRGAPANAGYETALASSLENTSSNASAAAPALAAARAGVDLGYGMADDPLATSSSPLMGAVNWLRTNVRPSAVNLRLRAASMVVLATVPLVGVTHANKQAHAAEIASLDTKAYASISRFE